MKTFAQFFRQSENHPLEAAEVHKIPHPSKSGAFRLAKAAQIFVIVLGSIAFAYVARPVVLPLLLAWLASMTLKLPVGWLRAWHLPVPLAAAVVLGFFLLGVGFGTAWLSRPAMEWIKSAPEQVQQLKQKYKNVLQPVLRFSAAASKIGDLDGTQNSTNAAAPVAVKDNHMIGAVFIWTRSLLVGIAEAVVLTFLLLVSGDKLTQKLAHTMPGQHKRRAVEISREIQHSISRYLFTISLINACLGCAVGLTFWMVGMPDAAMWGGLAAILNFLPFFGPTVGIIVVGVAGLFAFDTFVGALLPVAVYLALHLVESYFVTPFALGRRFSLNKAVIFVAFVFFTWLWGVFGALMAVPLLVSLKIICERVHALMPMAEFLSP